MKANIKDYVNSTVLTLSNRKCYLCPMKSVHVYLIFWEVAMKIRFHVGLFTVPMLLLMGCAHMQKASEEQAKHEHIREYKGLSQAEIFSGISQWVAQNFKSAKDVIQHSDPATGTLIVKGILPNATTYDALGVLPADIDFTLTVHIKEGKARFSYSNLSAYASKDRSRLKGFEEGGQFHSDAEKHFVQMEMQIGEFLIKKSKDDW